MATNDAPSIVPTLEAVGHLLREGVLEVPAYQRSYAWTDEQVDTYWFDLLAALVANEPIYFLGTIVISGGVGERSVVIDGQQRLATTTLLLAAIRDAFIARGDTTRPTTVQDRFLSWASLQSTEVEPRLILNEHDRGYFKEVVGTSAGAPPPIEGEPESVARLHAAFLNLTQKLNADVDAAGPHWQERLLAWVDLLDRTVRVIVVRVREDADAFLIFETLNARGLELSASDLIKNYLFGLCRHRLPEAQESWASMSRAIEASASSIEINTYLRHWWASSNGAVREKALYRDLKIAVQSQDQAVPVLQGLAGAAPLYAAMLNSDDDFWISRPVSSKGAMSVLLELGLEQYRPLLLAGLEMFSEDEADRLLRALASWSVRGLIAGGIGGGTTERYYAEAAVRIRNGRTRTVEAVLDDLDLTIANDDDFASAFATKRVVRTRLIHYYLRAIAERTAIPTRTESETAAIAVLPRAAPAATWSPYIDSEALTGTSMRIGNYMLIQRDRASQFSSVPAERISELTSVDLIAPSTTSEWSVDRVAERQRYLANLALETWPRRPR